MAQTAYNLAKSGKCPVMTMFWLKTQAGWRETSRLEHAGAVGTYDLSKVSDADLNQLQANPSSRLLPTVAVLSFGMYGGRPFLFL